MEENGTMAQAGIVRWFPSGPLSHLQDVELELHHPRTVGRTGQSRSCCCCDHGLCVTFHPRVWCQRLFAIGVLSEDRAGQLRCRAALESAVRASLVGRSYETLSFHLEERVQSKPDWVFVVLVAEGEPPLTAKDVESWKDSAAMVCAEQASCYVSMMSGTCCVFRAHLALQELIHLYVRSVEHPIHMFPGGILPRLVAEVKGCVDELGPLTGFNKLRLLGGLFVDHFVRRVKDKIGSGGPCGQESK